jgi:uncharacterized protein
VSLTEGVAGLKAMGSRLIRWRVSWIWYALALAVPLAVTFAAIGLNTAFGAPVPDIAEFSVWYGLPMAIAINMVNPSTPSSLRRRASGWAQRKLQTTRTPLAATVLVRRRCQKSTTWASSAPVRTSRTGEYEQLRVHPLRERLGS